MARSLVTYFAFAIFAFNMSIGLVNSIDGVWIDSYNLSLFGKTVDPYVTYNNLPDSQGIQINFSDNGSIFNATQRAASFSPGLQQSGVQDTFGFWTLAKNSIITIVSFLYRGFFGLPDFLWRNFSLDTIFVLPMYIVCGVVQILGIYEIIRGSSL